MTEITFCVSLSPSYLHFLPNLLESILRSFSSFKIILYILRPSSCQKSQVSTLLAQLNLSHATQIVIDNYQPISYSELRGHIANQRAHLLLTASQTATQYVCYVDVNTYLLPQLRCLYLKNNTADAFIIFDVNHHSIKACGASLSTAKLLSSSKQYKRTVGPLGTILSGSSLSGLQLYKVSPPVVSFLHEYVALLSNSKSWFASQEALSILYLRFKSILNFYLLEDALVGMANYQPNPLVAIYRKNGREKLYDDYVLHVNRLFCNLDQGYLSPTNPLLPRNSNSFSILTLLFSKIHRFVPYIFYLFYCRLLFTLCTLLHSKEYLLSLLHLSVSTDASKYSTFLSPYYPTTYSLYSGVLFRPVRFCVIFSLNIIAFPSSIHDYDISSFKPFKLL